MKGVNMEIRYLRIVVDKDKSEDLALRLCSKHLSAICSVIDSITHEWVGGQLVQKFNKLIDAVTCKKDYEEIYNLLKEYNAHVVNITDVESVDYDYNNWFKNGV